MFDAHVQVRIRVRGGVTSHSRSPDGGECGIRGGGTRRDVHRDPPKPAVRRNTKSP